jgi:Fic family protein
MSVASERRNPQRTPARWEPWLKFFLTGIAAVSLEATETARAIVDLRERHRRLGTERFGRAAANGLNVLEGLFSSPIVTVGQVQKSLGITYPPANALVQRFVDAGILFEMTGQERYRVYRYSPYINLFADNREEAQFDYGPSQG